ncbi:MAG TPA: homoserine dehydrogenase [Pirellulaceae bacterium]|nr:homoserine dehydrogenase [Pirellulaceae bacterium]
MTVEERVSHYERTHVALVGMGNVGTGVARLLLDLGDRTARYAGRTLWINHIVVRDLHKPRAADLPTNVLTNDLQRLLNDPQVTVVAHLVGGVEPARTILLKLLESGKDVVTANKALLAEHGPELFDRARELGRSIAFEAAVAGGIPIVANLSQCLCANRVLQMDGILNGTCNFIVTKMDEERADYRAALTEAQQRGFAEPDPTLDIDGSDAAQKLAILAHLAYGARVSWRQIPRRGIEQLKLDDFARARVLGYRIKLIACSHIGDDGLHLLVSPMLVRIGTPLAEVRENYNAVRVVGDAVGPVFFHGQGAGAMPTASAVVADMIDTAVGRTALTFQTLKLWSETEAPIEMARPETFAARFYIRFIVSNRPGVLAQLAGVLGKHKVSIATVYQESHDVLVPDDVPLVVLTHRTSQEAVRRAVDEIAGLTVVQNDYELLPILDEQFA